MLSVVGFAVVRCGLPSAGGAPRPDAIVRVVADDDGIVPGHPSEGAPQSPAWCSTLQMTVPSKVLRHGGMFADGERGAAAAVDELARVHARTLLMESMARRPQ